MRRPMARFISNMSLVGRRIYVTTNRPLDIRRGSVRVHNRTVRYEVGTRSPRERFVPYPNGVASLRLPNKGKVHISATICGSCTVPPCCSSVVTGVVICSGSHHDTVQGVVDTLKRITVRKMGAGISFLCRLLGRPSFRRKGVAASFVPRRCPSLWGGANTGVFCDSTRVACLLLGNG